MNGCWVATVEQHKHWTCGFVYIGWVAQKLIGENVCREVAQLMSWWQYQFENTAAHLSVCVYVCVLVLNFNMTPKKILNWLRGASSCGGWGAWKRHSLWKQFHEDRRRKGCERQDGQPVKSYEVEEVTRRRRPFGNTMRKIYISIHYSQSSYGLKYNPWYMCHGPE